VRYGLFFIMIMSLLSLGSFVYASPIQNSLSVESQEIWLGESETIFFNCTDANSTISDVYADISTKTAFFPNNQFTKDSNGLYYLAISTAQSSSFNKVGVFDIIAYCVNNESESIDASISFVVSNLTLDLNNVISSIYIGNPVELNVWVKKDGNPITSEVSFVLSIDNINMQLISQPYYDFVKGWVLGFDTSNLASGKHTLSVTATYSNGSMSFEKTIIIQSPIEFSVINVDKSWVSTGDEIIAEVKAKDHGDSIAMEVSYLSVSIGSKSIDITEISAISATGTHFVKFKAPSLSSGTYNLKINFNYGNSSFIYSESIVYVIQVAGTLFLDSDNLASIDIKFKSDDFSKSLKTDTNGKYSTELPIGVYDVQFEHSLTTLDIYDMDITSFDDVLKYQSIASRTVDGIYGSGIFYYEITSEFDYSYTTLKIPYDSKIIDVSSLETYVCKAWNSGTRKCISAWEIINSVIDTKKRTATITNAPFDAAYIVGNKYSLDVGVTVNKAVYNFNDIIQINGLSQDSAKNTIPTVIINATIEGTPIKSSTISDSNGVFSFNIENPKLEGNYTLIIDMYKSPYLSIQKKIPFVIQKSKELSIVSVDTVRLHSGESSEVKFLLINSGESDLSNLLISLTNIPSSYYQIISPNSIESLKTSGEISVSVYFDIPKDAPKAIISAFFNVNETAFSKKENFVINILPPENDTVTLTQVESNLEVPSFSFSGLMPSFSAPTGLSLFIASQGEIFSLFTFTIVSLSTAFFMRKRRLTKAYISKLRQSNRQLIFDIRQNMCETPTIKKSITIVKKNTKKRIKKVFKY